MSAEGPSPTRAGLLVLSYLAILGFIPLLISRDREARWHARNGLLLFGVVFVAGLILTAIGILVPSTTCLYAVAMGIVSMAYVGIVVLAIVLAVQGQRLMIPGVSAHASRLSAKD
jgi:uncharacterized membrane protein